MDGGKVTSVGELMAERKMSAAAVAKQTTLSKTDENSVHLA